MSAWDRSNLKADQANTGGVVRRATHDLETYASVKELVEEARDRGFHVIETGDQIVVLCHLGEIIIHC